MDLIRLVNQINNELLILADGSKKLLTEEEMVKVSNSLVATISANLVDIIRFSIVNSRTGVEIFAWKYEIKGQDHVVRNGPPVADIVKKVEESSDAVSFTWAVDWSQHFESLDIRQKQQLLRNTKWQDLGETAMQKPLMNLGQHQKLLTLASVKQEIQSTLIPVHLLYKKDVERLIRDLDYGVALGLIKGITFSLQRKSDGYEVHGWSYILDSASSKFSRRGNSHEELISVLDRGVGDLFLKTKPVLTAKFEQLPLKDREDFYTRSFWGGDIREKEEGLWSSLKKLR